MTTTSSAPNSEPQWALFDTAMPVPAWSIEYNEAPPQEDSLSAWTQFTDSDTLSRSSCGMSPVASHAREDTRFPYIAGGCDDGHNPSASAGVGAFATPWKSAFYGAGRFGEDDAFAEDPRQKVAPAPFLAPPNYYTRGPYSDFNGESEQGSPSADLYGYVNDPIDGHMAANGADMSPSQLSPPTLSRQSTNESAVSTDFGSFSVMGDEAFPSEGKFSDARSAFRRHLDHVESMSVPSPTKINSPRRRSTQGGRSRRSSAGHVPASASRKSSVSDKKHLVCPLCNKVFQRDLARHLRTHEATARFICPFPRDQCSHKRGQFNRGYDFKKHLLHYHFTFTDPSTARKLRDLNGKLGFQGLCCCGSDHEFDAEEWLDEHITCDPPKCPLLKGRTREVVLQEAIERAAAESRQLA